MNKRGYTIMEAVIAMFLVVVMVGAVFSALMSSRRAIISSSEKEEILYSINSTYALLKDCRSNPECHLIRFNSDNGVGSCPHSFSTVTASGVQNLKGCNDLFTFNFQNLCKNNTAGNFEYSLEDTPVNMGISAVEPGGSLYMTYIPHHYYTLKINAKCTES